ncbi:MAG: radical SAM protein [Candidatus Aenigmarchaeota archaeon]|nr:radical SAM protein [Candidatus Aenigmarchaeota archaeon]
MVGVEGMAKLGQIKRYLSYMLSYNLNIPLRYPHEVNFQMTNRCPLRCKMCEIWKLNANPKKELSVDVMKRIMDECRDLGINYISFVGGEALVRRKDTLELVGYANSKGLHTTIVSNAYFLDEKVCEKLLDVGLNRLALSLDGAKRETHDFIRGRGNYDKVIEAAKTILKLRKKKQIKVDFTSVVMSYNFRELVDIYWLGKKIGVDQVFYQAVVLDNTFKNFDYNEEVWINGEDLEDLKSIIKKLISLKRQDDFIFNSVEYLRSIPEYFEKRGNFKFGACLAGFMNLNIDPYGNISVCGLGPNLNVRDRRISDLWTHEEFSKTRSLIKRCKRPCLMLCYEKFGIRDMFKHLIS